MKDHESSISSISIHASGRHALTTANEIAQIWDLDTFTKKKTLNGAQTVGIQQVFFLPLSNTMISSFKDDSIFAWDFESLVCKYQLPIPEGQPPHYRAFATPKDGRLLAAGGRSHFLHIWTLESKKLLRIIDLPTKVRLVKQLNFIADSFDGGSSQTLGILSQDGIIRFVNIHTCKLVFEVGSHEKRISSFNLSPNGSDMACIMDSGSINIYSIPALTSHLKQAPAPVFKTLVDDRLRKKTGGDSTVESTSMEDPRKRVETSSFSKRRTVVKPSWLKPSETTTEDEQSTVSDGLSHSRLKAILKGYGEYPAKYRMFIWRSLLELPENHAAFCSLVDKGTHSAFVRLHENYPIKSRKLLRILQRILSALAHWSAVFGETEYLPLLVFPFVKLFQNNQLICFEVVATVLVNWCQNWFEFFPNPPINLLGMVENLLVYHDKNLLHHLVQADIKSQIYCWPIIETLFSEVLTKEEWLRIWDHIFSNHPSFLLFLVTSYLICSRKVLLQCTAKEDFEYFVHHRNACDISAVIQEAYHLQNTSPSDIDPGKMLEDFKPLTKGQYPVFNKYPKFIVDYQVQERERIRQEELEYLQQRQLAVELKKQAEQRKESEEAFYRKQELMMEAEKQRRDLILLEEQKLADQRVRLQAMKREVHTRELQLMDAVRRKYMENQSKIKEVELKRMDDEIQRKAMQREQETQAALDDIEIKNLELQAQKEALQHELAKKDVKATFELRAGFESHQRQKELEDELFRRATEMREETDLNNNMVKHARLGNSQQRNLDLETQTDLELRKRLDDMETELQQTQLTKRILENKSREGEIAKLIEDSKEKEDGIRRSKAAELGRQQYLARMDEERRLRHLNTQSDYSTPSRDTGEVSGPSLERQRATFEKREIELMADVRELRRKLAERLTKPSRLSYEDTETSSSLQNADVD
ncbi:TBC1 domain family member 31-like [Dendronephthya gigantea]|uniref:TBC1 domain family member 31-like n=1 Tax=Dendronephthya gigantea TaxID=151771 RepID=UPI00106CBC88|nr:TBC1 domain family member 31-like [Dendronephthya gigantea]